MSLSQFLSILRARRALALMILLSTLVLALGWVLLRPASYKAIAPVLVDVQRPDPTTGAASYAYVQGLVAPSYMATQIDIVKSDRVAERVVQLLPADQPPVRKLAEQAKDKSRPPQWVAHQLQEKL